ncbi:hypothetical protein N7G274_006447 [Stereocaulon virgatum]|uniref:Uncharacterized protein n=1 Tax=Stereocaulon virgatum TaxID=373712 RepID=A0ABR4A666_9LECA
MPMSQLQSKACEHTLATITSTNSLPIFSHPQITTALLKFLTTMSSGMMDTEPGGESDQYQSQKTITNPHSKQGGQMGNPETQIDAVDSEQAKQQAERREKTAENVRYGQTISEGGMGGKTTEAGGSANQGDGYGGTEAQQGGYDDQESRRDQGYGPGSGVGA